MSHALTRIVFALCAFYVLRNFAPATVCLATATGIRAGHLYAQVLPSMSAIVCATVHGMRQRLSAQLRLSAATTGRFTLLDAYFESACIAAC